MGQVYLIPDSMGVEQSVSLLREYGGAFEYNDFWRAEVLEDRQKQEKIIEHYAKFRTDFSQDTMHGAFLDVTVHSEDSLIREISRRRICQSMDIAKRMGLRGVVFHTGLLGGFRVKYYLEHWKKENAAFFAEMAERYPDQEIFMENMFDGVPDELAWLGERLREVGNFGVCLDYAHGMVTDCEPESWVQRLAPYIRHIHINDNDLRNDLHQPVGEGKIDWFKFEQLMQQYDIASTVLVEVKGYEAQKKSLEYLKKHHIFPLNQ
ncbi:MAG: TIM barrel protein [Lachnospiraceae bacterium]|nr:TIM barrel protein [Lachnospiraceae bacterium]